MMRAPTRLLLATLAATAALLSVSACAPLVVGGAAVGSLVAVDRRTSGTQLEDEGIDLRASARIREILGDRVHVNVSSYNRQVLLTGEVPSDREKQQVEQIVSRVENVRSVVNELAVMGISTLAQRSSDALVTGKVKASLVDDKELYAGAFRVVTERGTTYLMGRVTQREAARATEITRSVGGVQKVVRLFEIITDQELQQIAPSHAKPANAGR